MATRKHCWTRRFRHTSDQCATVTTSLRSYPGHPRSVCSTPPYRPQNSMGTGAPDFQERHEVMDPKPTRCGVGGDTSLHQDFDAAGVAANLEAKTLRLCICLRPEEGCFRRAVLQTTPAATMRHGRKKNLMCILWGHGRKGTYGKQELQVKTVLSM